MAPGTTIAVCSSVTSKIEPFITKVSSLTNVDVVELPDNDLGFDRLSGFDGVIVCHSVSNCHLAVDDAVDILFDKFLLTFTKNSGATNVCVIVHDFPMGPTDSSLEDHATIKSAYTKSFQNKLSSTFDHEHGDCPHKLLVCGRLDNQVDMDEAEWTQLEDFVRQCQMQPASAEASQRDRHVRMFRMFLMQLLMVFLAGTFLVVVLTIKLYRSLGTAGVSIFMISLISMLYYCYSKDQASQLITKCGFGVIMVAVTYFIFFLINNVCSMYS
ncbi:uncharacterized protein LOC121410724 [Lytechinus variegatus]|uniref:uncharacterized protein LOC121410724 n=1 Tax=Lytechinus variegatus TaxID=7654 RepID=UPI001BB1331B|nr:uncharacterized protein LOC121410724 [Lytechinus variegatus]